MALARIITRSHECSRQLALDLLARGYAVEIVSPDKIPDNLADLELRVDTDPGNQLVASVESHDGPRTASLDFVHHLKAPMMDFIRRPPHSSERGREVGDTVKPSAAGVDSIAASKPPAPQLASSPAESHRTSAVAVKKPERPSAELAVLVKAPTRSVRSSIVRQRLAIRPVSFLASRPAESAWRAALTLACIVLLALLLWSGIRNPGRSAARTSASAPGQKVVEGPGNTLNADSAKVSDHAVSANQVSAPVQSQVVNAALTDTRGSKPGNSRRKLPKHADDYIAPNTVIYLDQHAADVARSKPTSPSARPDPNPGTFPNGVVTVNSKTSLVGKPTADTAKNSTTKPVSAAN
jgi:hypothetical protein